MCQVKLLTDYNISMFILLCLIYTIIIQILTKKLTIILIILLILTKKLTI